MVICFAAQFGASQVIEIQSLDAITSNLVSCSIKKTSERPVASQEDPQKKPMEPHVRENDMRVWDSFLTCQDKASLAARPDLLWEFGLRPALITCRSLSLGLWRSSSGIA